MIQLVIQVCSWSTEKACSQRAESAVMSARPDSDVDLLYVRVPGNDLGMSYFALQDDLAKLFGRPVDLVPKEGLHRVIRDQVLADAQVLYAA